jgi:squalene synthase HpnC
MRVAASHYENFPVASRFVSKDRRRYVAAIYAFARIADDIADEPGLTTAERIDHLKNWEQQLRDCYEGQAKHPVFVALAETADRFEIPAELFADLLTAFKSDVTVRRYETFADLLEYCKHSANPIGRLMLLLFNYRSEQYLLWSDAICTSLQLTNFWQDVAIDLEKDRIYIPLSDMARYEFAEKDLLQHRMGASFRNLLAHEIAKTQGLFEEGRPLLNAVGRELRYQLKITWNGGMRILEKIKMNEYDVFRTRPTLSLMDKFTILQRSLRY